MRYYCLHFAIQPLPTLFDYSGKTKIKREDFDYSIIENILKENKKYIPTDERRKPIYFGELVYSNNELRGGKVGKERTEQLNRFDEENSSFPANPQQNYPTVIFAWDRKRQMIVIERKGNVFHKDEHVIEAFENHINKYLNPQGYKISFIPISTENDFWKIIDTSDVKSVEFKLYIPNAIGYTNLEVSKVLETAKEEMNITEMTTTVTNENGNLKVERKNGFIANCLDWVNKGEGVWKILAKTGKIVLSTQRLTYEENDNLKSVAEIENIENVIEAAGSKYDKILEKRVKNDKNR